MSGPVGVYLVDARSIWRSGLREALEDGRSFVVVGEASDHAAAAQDARLARCDVLVTSWPPIKWEELPDLRRLPTLALMREGAEPGSGLRALRAGAAACLYDDVGAVDLRAAVGFVHEGGCLVDPRVAAAVSEQMHGNQATTMPRLTEVEAKVAGCVARGCTNREIAMETGLSERTVVTIISTLLQKLSAPTRSAVAAWWMRQGGDPRS